MARRAYNGGAVPTTVTAQVNPTDISIALAAAVNWPTGGGSGEFVCTLNPGLPNEERILVQSRSGTTLTLANTSKRGVDGTSAATHAVNSVIIHSDAAFEADEANRHINDSAQAESEHTGLLNAARHAAVSHTAAMIGTDQVGTDEIAPNSVTATEIAANAVTTAKILDLNVTTAKINDLAVTAAKIANNTITAGQIAPDTITAAEIAANAITASELADNAVDANAILAAAVVAGKIAAGGVSATNQVADGILTLAKLFLEDPVDYAPTEASFGDSAGGAVTLGTGGTRYGYYFKAGRLVVFLTGFSMAANGNIPSGTTVRIPAPFTQRALGTMRGFVAARARRASPEAYASGTGVIQAGNAFGENIATAGASAQWDATSPWNWGTPGDASNVTLDAVGIMVSNT